MARGLDALRYYIFSTLREKDVPHAELVARKAGEAFARYRNWRSSDKDLRELRKQVTFAILAQEEDINKVTALVDDLFTVLQRGTPRADMPHWRDKDEFKARVFE